VTIRSSWVVENGYVWSTEDAKRMRLYRDRAPEVRGKRRHGGDLTPFRLAIRAQIAARARR